MSTDNTQKISADHLRRDAFLYVRQSSLRQVFENTESTKRQYALRERAVALGWPIERIRTIDSDLGISGAHAENRDGFQELVSEVALTCWSIFGPVDTFGVMDSSWMAVRHQCAKLKLVLQLKPFQKEPEI
jgi:hypothetical protein